MSGFKSNNNQPQDRFLEYMKKDEANSLLFKIRDVLIRKFEICKKLVTEKNIELLQNFASALEDGGKKPEQIMTTVSSILDDADNDSDNIEEIDEEDAYDSSNDDVESSIIK